MMAFQTNLLQIGLVHIKNVNSESSGTQAENLWYFIRYIYVRFTNNLEQQQLHACKIN